MTFIYVVQCLEYGDLMHFSSAKKAAKYIYNYDAAVNLSEHEIVKKLKKNESISFNLKVYASETVTASKVRVI